LETRTLKRNALAQTPSPGMLAMMIFAIKARENQDKQ
jgi:hypothetical protein